MLGIGCCLHLTTILSVCCSKISIDTPWVLRGLLRVRAYIPPTALALRDRAPLLGILKDPGI